MKILCTIMSCTLVALACIGVAVGTEQPMVYAVCAAAYAILTAAYKE